MTLPRLALAYLTVVWVLVALYPDPGMLPRSIANLATARADPAAAAALAATLPDDPRLVEAYLLGTPYSYDWQTFGVPWYFPTAAEALRAGRGDCESRAVRLASLLTAKRIPNELRVALNHIWVDYPGKEASALENAGLEIAGRREGAFFLRWPEQLDLRDEIADQIAITWAPMPFWRLLVLLAGLAVVPLFNVWAGLLPGAAARRPAAPLVSVAPARRRRRRARRAPSVLHPQGR